ncbi:Dynamitin-domain-containing protein [Kickxella alabastrina]|uniref:Dynamitin-domain-containing protein n=1 Tax=Kickxella alabastrina TaxID=61397 RepID=UPI00221F8769|nr:Dynamitin-domain-containing protein [Kickxella alabastrina]KAI7821485.1 Dynamitin-domain-containing protein [Kickxella alabastrina]
MSARVASKYSNLPDIDLDQPDVYETTDEPQEMDLDIDQPATISEDISTESVSATQAAERFRQASGDEPPKTALARYQKSLFRTLQLDSLPEQRLRRLVYETQELKEQIEEEKGGAGGGGVREGSVELMKLACGLNEELAFLGRQIGGGSGLVSRELWQRLDGTPTATASGAEGKKLRPKEEPSVLEQRIAGLEKILGNSSSGNHNQQRSLVDSVSRLRQQMDVLADPNRVDGIQRRIKQVLVDMERLDLAQTQATRALQSSEDPSKGQRLDPAVVKKIDEVYDKLMAVDALVELAPAAARRLQTLAKLHVEASDAVAGIKRIEREQGAVKEELGTMGEVAEGLRKAIGENSLTLKDNMLHLDARIKTLSERLQKIGH